MITLDKTGLLAAIKKVMPGVESGKSTIEGADTILFTPGFIHTYNGFVAVSAAFDTQGFEGAVIGKDFFGLLSRLGGMMVTLEVQGNKLKVTDGRTRATMTMADPSTIKAYVGTLNLDQVQFKPLPSDFADAFTICKIANNATPLAGIAVQEGEHAKVMATDSVRICTYTMDGPMESTWIEDGMAADMFKLGTPKEYGMAKPWFHAKYEDGTIYSANTKDPGQYPFGAVDANVDKVSSAPVKLAGRLPKDIAEAAGRVAVLASAAAGDNKSLVRLTFTKDALELFTSKSTGEASESIAWDSELHGDLENPVQVWVSVEFLVEASMKSMDFKLVSAGTFDALLFTSGSYTQMVATSSK